MTSETLLNPFDISASVLCLLSATSHLHQGRRMRAASLPFSYAKEIDAKSDAIQLGVGRMRDLFVRTRATRYPVRCKSERCRPPPPPNARLPEPPSPPTPAIWISL